MGSPPALADETVMNTDRVASRSHVAEFVADRWIVHKSLFELAGI
jgi:hypothetical protein